MWTESSELENALSHFKVSYRKLTMKEGSEVRYYTYSKYSLYTNNIYQAPFWEYLRSFDQVVNDYACNWLADLLKGEEILVFFEERRDKNVFLIYDGGILPALLDECAGFTFYVTNFEYSFLYAWHHDHSLFRVSGEAKVKLRDFINKRGIKVEIT